MKYRMVLDKDAEEEIVAVVHAPSSLTEQIENLVFSYMGEDYLLGASDEGIRKLSFSDVECVTILERKMIAIDSEGKEYRLRDTLRDLEERLPSYFIRINKSTLANEHRIVQFKTTFTGGVDALFQCGYRDYVSRRCFSEIKRRLENL